MPSVLVIAGASLYATTQRRYSPGHGTCILPSNSKHECLFAQAWDLGAQELQLQAWGDSAGRLFSVGLDLAAIDAARIVVKLPVTAEGVEAAAYLKDRNVRVTLTGTRAPLDSESALQTLGQIPGPTSSFGHQCMRPGPSLMIRSLSTNV